MLDLHMGRGMHGVKDGDFGTWLLCVAALAQQVVAVHINIGSCRSKGSI